MKRKRKKIMTFAVGVEKASRCHNGSQQTAVWWTAVELEGETWWAGVSETKSECLKCQQKNAQALDSI